MVNIRLFIPINAIKKEQIIKLSPNQAHYLSVVMRCIIGDQIFVFNGSDGEWSALIEKCDRKNVIIKIIEQVKPQIMSWSNIQLAFAPIKNVAPGFIVQKATELGVSVIHPVITQRTIVRKINIDKLKAIAIEAAEQCMRTDIPQILPIIHLSNFLSNIKEQHIILCNETENKVFLHEISAEILTMPNNIVLIGPEGGFTKDELFNLTSIPTVHSVSLGQYTMRAETAVIAALSVFSLLMKAR